jgi:hypothetical protein
LFGCFGDVFELVELEIFEREDLGVFFSRKNWMRLMLMLMLTTLMRNQKQVPEAD